jgi:rubrerythrin
MFNRSGPNRALRLEWQEELRELETRWFSFLEKLEARMEELCSAALPELRALRSDTGDADKQVYQRVLSGLTGQLQNIRDKAYATHDEKVIDTWYRFKAVFKMTDSFFDTGYAFRQRCTKRYDEFEETLRGWDALLRETGRENLEEEYRRVLEIFQANKEKFRCKQCGAPIPIPQVFFITVHLACPACATRNTFDPGSEARQLPFIVRDLAEKRTAPLYEAYQNGGRTPELYRRYARARCDELNRMLPDLKEHHETLYQLQTQGDENNG